MPATAGPDQTPDCLHFLPGVPEPLEFMFMFCAMPLYIVYALLQGCAFAMAGVIDLRLHSFGNLEFISRLPMVSNAGLMGDVVNCRGDACQHLHDDT